MSRTGQLPVKISKDVKAKIDSGTVNLEGPKGKLSLRIPLGIKVEQSESGLSVNRVSDTKQNRSNHGTIRAVLSSMVVGVTQGHKKELEIQGIGLRAQLQGDKLLLNLGFSHPVEFVIPTDVKVATPKPTQIVIEGADKVSVGNVAAKIRALKPPEPYKGKGIRYLNEFVRRKQGKSVTK